LVGKIADWHLTRTSGAPADPAFSQDSGPLGPDAIDALVFRATDATGQPCTIEDLHLGSAILATAYWTLTPDGCAIGGEDVVMEIRAAGERTYLLDTGPRPVLRVTSEKGASKTPLDGLALLDWVASRQPGTLGRPHKA
jgi:hypothetical protein